MIKRFESFGNSVDDGYFVGVFGELIDGGSEYEFTDSHFEIFIDIPGVRRGERKWEKNPKIESYLSASKKQTELLEDINIAIKRVYDEFNIFPKIKEEDYENGWSLHITYEL